VEVRLQKFYAVQTVGRDALFRLHFRKVTDRDLLLPLAARFVIADVVLSQFVRPQTAGAAIACLILSRVLTDRVLMCD
jgi:hypothetical protein